MVKIICFAIQFAIAKVIANSENENENEILSNISIYR